MDDVTLLMYIGWLLFFAVLSLLVYLVCGGKVDRKQVSNLLDGVYDFVYEHYGDDVKEWSQDTWARLDRDVRLRVKDTPMERIWDYCTGYASDVDELGAIMDELEEEIEEEE